MLETLNIKTKRRIQMIDITGDISKIVSDNNVKSGISVVYVPHTTAAITINESADPSVKDDIITKLKELVPESGKYTHLEGNSDSHIKTSIFGASEQIIIEGGKLVLGTWQNIYFCEFDGPRNRKAYVKLIKQ